MENKIAIFKDAETILEVPVSTEEKTVWLKPTTNVRSVRQGCKDHW